MKISTYQKIVCNHNFGLNTPIGHCVYDIQFDYMAGIWRVIRCLKSHLKGHKAVQYDFCGNSIEPTSGTNWEWRERVPDEVLNWIKK